MEASLLAGQAVIVWLPALWMALGALENIRNPAVNRESVAEVMAMTRMAETHPARHAVFRRNRVRNARIHVLVFRLIVVAEGAVALLLLAGAGALTLAFLGLAGPAPARALAAWGCLGFAAIWGAFLVGGQWFHYWCGHEGAQATHFACLLWGMLAFAVLHL